MELSNLDSKFMSSHLNLRQVDEMKKFEKKFANECFFIKVDIELRLIKLFQVRLFF